MSADTGWQPRPRQWWGLGLALTLGAAPHLLRLPLWLTSIWLLAVGWRMSLGVQGRPKPALLIRLLSTLAAGVALYLHFGTVLGRDAGSALLVMMAGLKLLELKQRRDATLIIMLCYLLLAIQFMFAQDIFTALYVTLAGVVITAVRIEQSNQVGKRPWQDDLLLAVRMLGQALPLMLLLFLLFPRLPGPLWSLPSDAHGARSGLSGEMEPGRISDLALSEAVAFRADFEGALPPPAQRYWRGPVFEMTDGRRWWSVTPETFTPARAITRLPFTPQGTAYRYTLTLEPSKAAWLPALEMAASVPDDAIRLPSLELKAQRGLENLRRDSFISYPDYSITQTDDSSLTRNLRLPALSARVRALAHNWRQGAGQDRDVVNAALQHFNTEPFVYTLQPPLLGADPVDEFLFESRRGFCEHYASSFTVLMRAAGIPARVVTGYQGGEVNPVGGYLIVRQSDAHAWAEVWLDKQGWVRVDPTAAVAPERIEHRIDLGLARSGDAIRFQLDDDSLIVRAWRRGRFAFDAMNNGWNQWVLSYSPERQRDVFAWLGMQAVGWQQMAWALFIGVGSVVLALAVFLLRQQRPPRDPVAQLYQHFLHRLRKQGYTCAAHEGPRDLLARLTRSGHPAIRSCQDIIECYIALRYAALPTTNGVVELRRAVRAFNRSK